MSYGRNQQLFGNENQQRDAETEEMERELNSLVASLDEEMKDYMRALNKYKQSVKEINNKVALHDELSQTLEKRNETTAYQPGK